MAWRPLTVGIVTTYDSGTMVVVNADGKMLVPYFLW